MKRAVMIVTRVAGIVAVTVAALCALILIVDHKDEEELGELEDY